MPVAKVSNYDVVVKNLRGRKISCFVTAVTENNSGKDTSSAFDHESSLNTSSIKHKGPQRKGSLQLTNFGLKKQLNPKQSLDSCVISLTDKSGAYEDQVVSGLASQSKKHTKFSASGLNSENVLSTPEKLPKKRGNKSLSDLDLQPKIQSGLDHHNVLHSRSENLPKKKGKKSTERRQMPKKRSIKEVTEPDLNSDNAVTAPDISDVIMHKRYHRKHIPSVPHNTPISFISRSDGDSTCTVSSLSQTSDLNSPDDFGKKTFFSMPVPTWEEESTCTSSTFSQDELSTPRRKRRSRWYMDFSDLEEEEQVSEYELQRRKNIEENLKMLKQIFSEHGLQFEQKSTETPKSRKSYSKLPLPPPRPRSARIGIRRTNDNIDFSK